MRVAPLEVVLAHVAHFYLVAGRVVRHVGQHPSLEELHQHVLLARPDLRSRPVGIGDRQAHREQPVNHRATPHHPIEDRPLLVHKLPEDARNVVAGDGVVLDNLGLRGCQFRTQTNGAAAIDRGGYALPEALRVAVAVVERGYPGKVAITGRVGVLIARVAGHRNVGGSALLDIEGVIAKLQAPAHQFLYQQAVGHTQVRPRAIRRVV